MSASFDGVPSQIAAASNRQVRFTLASDDVAAADACDGLPSRARRLGSDDAIERFNSGVSYPVQVKNTFIEWEDEEGEEDATPRRRRPRGPRSRTEPSCTAGCELRRGASEASTNASSDEDDAPTVGEPTGERGARRGSSEERIERFNSGGSYPVQVKNTFIEMGEDSEEEDPMSLSLWPRSKTEPNGALGCDLLIDPDEAGSDASCDEGGGAPTVDEPAGERARCGSSDDALKRFNSGGSYSVQVKNTFIEVEDEGEEEDPMSPSLWPRHKTAPNGVLGVDLLDSDEASSDEDGGAPTVGESARERARCSGSEELINRFNSGGSYSVQVKNTFIEFEEDGEEEDPMSLFPRSKTVPNGALSCDPLLNRDGAGSDSCGEDDAAPAAGEPATGLAAQLPTPFCSTPTPRWQAPLPALWPAAAADSGAWLALGHASDVAERPRRQELEEGPAKAEEVARSAGAAARSEGSGPRDPKTTGGGRSLQQQTLQTSEADGFSRAQWTVDGRKLRSSDKRLVSPSFDLDLGLGSGPMAFVLVLYPKSATFKGSSSFKEAGGLGHVHLKCVSELGDDAAAVKVRLSIGRGPARQLRGPCVHSFAASPLFALPKDQAEWDFGAAVEERPASLFVSVDVALA